MFILSKKTESRKTCLTQRNECNGGLAGTAAWLGGRALDERGLPRVLLTQPTGGGSVAGCHGSPSPFLEAPFKSDVVTEGL